MATPGEDEGVSGACVSRQFETESVVPNTTKPKKKKKKKGKSLKKNKKKPSGTDKASCGTSSKMDPDDRFQDLRMRAVSILRSLYKDLSASLLAPRTVHMRTSEVNSKNTRQYPLRTINRTGAFATAVLRHTASGITLMLTESLRADVDIWALARAVENNSQTAAAAAIGITNTDFTALVEVLGLRSARGCSVYNSQQEDDDATGVCAEWWCVIQALHPNLWEGKKKTSSWQKLMQHPVKSIEEGLYNLQQTSVDSGAKRALRVLGRAHDRPLDASFLLLDAGSVGKFDSKSCCSTLLCEAASDLLAVHQVDGAYVEVSPSALVFAVQRRCETHSVISTGFAPGDLWASWSLSSFSVLERGDAVLARQPINSADLLGVKRAAQLNHHLFFALQQRKHEVWLETAVRQGGCIPHILIEATINLNEHSQVIKCEAKFFSFSRNNSQIQTIINNAISLWCYQDADGTVVVVACNQNLHKPVFLVSDSKTHPDAQDSRDAAWGTLSSVLAVHKYPGHIHRDTRHAVFFPRLASSVPKFLESSTSDSREPTRQSDIASFFSRLDPSVSASLAPDPAIKPNTKKKSKPRSTTERHSGCSEPVGGSQWQALSVSPDSTGRNPNKPSLKKRDKNLSRGSRCAGEISVDGKDRAESNPKKLHKKKRRSALLRNPNLPPHERGISLREGDSAPGLSAGTVLDAMNSPSAGGSGSEVVCAAVEVGLGLQRSVLSAAEPSAPGGGGTEEETEESDLEDDGMIETIDGNKHNESDSSEGFDDDFDDPDTFDTDTNERSADSSDSTASSNSSSDEYQPRGAPRRRHSRDSNQSDMEPPCDPDGVEGLQRDRRRRLNVRAFVDDSARDRTEKLGRRRRRRRRGGVSGVDGISDAEEDAEAYESEQDRKRLVQVGATRQGFLRDGFVVDSSEVETSQYSSSCDDSEEYRNSSNEDFVDSSSDPEQSDDSHDVDKSDSDVRPAKRLRLCKGSASTVSPHGSRIQNLAFKSLKPMEMRIVEKCRDMTVNPSTYQNDTDIEHLDTARGIVVAFDKWDALVPSSTPGGANDDKPDDPTPSSSLSSVSLLRKATRVRKTLKTLLDLTPITADPDDDVSMSDGYATQDGVDKSDGSDELEGIDRVHKTRHTGNPAESNVNRRTRSTLPRGSLQHYALKGTPKFATAPPAGVSLGAKILRGEGELFNSKLLATGRARAHDALASVQMMMTAVHARNPEGVSSALHALWRTANKGPLIVPRKGSRFVVVRADAMAMDALFAATARYSMLHAWSDLVILFWLKQHHCPQHTGSFDPLVWSILLAVGRDLTKAAGATNLPQTVVGELVTGAHAPFAPVAGPSVADSLWRKRLSAPTSNHGGGGGDVVSKKKLTNARRTAAMEYLLAARVDQRGIATHTLHSLDVSAPDKTPAGGTEQKDSNRLSRHADPNRKNKKDVCLSPTTQTAQPLHSPHQTTPSQRTVVSSADDSGTVAPRGVTTPARRAVLPWRQSISSDPNAEPVAWGQHVDDDDGAQSLLGDFTSASTLSRPSEKKINVQVWGGAAGSIVEFVRVLTAYGAWMEVLVPDHGGHRGLGNAVKASRTAAAALLLSSRQNSDVTSGSGGVSRRKRGRSRHVPVPSSGDISDILAPPEKPVAPLPMFTYNAVLFDNPLAVDVLYMGSCALVSTAMKAIVQPAPVADTAGGKTRQAHTNFEGRSRVIGTVPPTSMHSARIRTSMASVVAPPPFVENTHVDKRINPVGSAVDLAPSGDPREKSNVQSAIKSKLHGPCSDAGVGFVHSRLEGTAVEWAVARDSESCRIQRAMISTCAPLSDNVGFFRFLRRAVTNSVATQIAPMSMVSGEAFRSLCLESMLSCDVALAQILHHYHTSADRFTPSADRTSRVSRESCGSWGSSNLRSSCGGIGDAEVLLQFPHFPTPPQKLPNLTSDAAALHDVRTSHLISSCCTESVASSVMRSVAVRDLQQLVVQTRKNKMLSLESTLSLTKSWKDLNSSARMQSQILGSDFICTAKLAELLQKRVVKNSLLLSPGNTTTKSADGIDSNKSTEIIPWQEVFRKTTTEGVLYRLCTDAGVSPVAMCECASLMWDSTHTMEEISHIALMPVEIRAVALLTSMVLELPSTSNHMRTVRDLCDELGGDPKKVADTATVSLQDGVSRQWHVDGTRSASVSRVSLTTALLLRVYSQATSPGGASCGTDVVNWVAEVNSTWGMRHSAVCTLPGVAPHFVQALPGVDAIARDPWKESLFSQLRKSSLGLVVPRDWARSTGPPVLTNRRLSSVVVWRSRGFASNQNVLSVEVNHSSRTLRVQQREVHQTVSLGSGSVQRETRRNSFEVKLSFLQALEHLHTDAYHKLDPSTRRTPISDQIRASMAWTQEPGDFPSAPARSVEELEEAMVWLRPWGVFLWNHACADDHLTQLDPNVDLHQKSCDGSPEKINSEIVLYSGDSNHTTTCPCVLFRVLSMFCKGYALKQPTEVLKETHKDSHGDTKLGYLPHTHGRPGCFPPQAHHHRMILGAARSLLSQKHHLKKGVHTKSTSTSHNKTSSDRVVQSMSDSDSNVPTGRCEIRSNVVYPPFVLSMACANTTARGEWGTGVFDHAWDILMEPSAPGLVESSGTGTGANERNTCDSTQKIGSSLGYEGVNQKDSSESKQSHKTNINPGGVSYTYADEVSFFPPFHLPTANVARFNMKGDSKGFQAFKTAEWASAWVPRHATLSVSACDLWTAGRLWRLAEALVRMGRDSDDSHALADISSEAWKWVWRLAQSCQQASAGMVLAVSARGGGETGCEYTVRAAVQIPLCCSTKRLLVALLSQRLIVWDTTQRRWATADGTHSSTWAYLAAALRAVCPPPVSVVSTVVTCENSNSKMYRRALTSGLRDDARALSDALADLTHASAKINRAVLASALLRVASDLEDVAVGRRDTVQLERSQVTGLEGSLPEGPRSGSWTRAVRRKLLLSLTASGLCLYPLCGTPQGTAQVPSAGSLLAALTTWKVADNCWARPAARVLSDWCYSLAQDLASTGTIATKSAGSLFPVAMRVQDDAAGDPRPMAVLCADVVMGTVDREEAELLALEISAHSDPAGVAEARTNVSTEHCSFRDSGEDRSAGVLSSAKSLRSVHSNTHAGRQAMAARLQGCFRRHRELVTSENRAHPAVDTATTLIAAEMATVESTGFLTRAAWDGGLPSGGWLQDVVVPNSSQLPLLVWALQQLTPQVGATLVITSRLDALTNWVSADRSPFERVALIDESPASAGLYSPGGTFVRGLMPSTGHNSSVAFMKADVTVVTVEWMCHHRDNFAVLEQTLWQRVVLAEHCDNLAPLLGANDHRQREHALLESMMNIPRHSGWVVSNAPTPILRARRRVGNFAMHMLPATGALLRRTQLSPFNVAQHVVQGGGWNTWVSTGALIPAGSLSLTKARALDVLRNTILKGVAQELSWDTLSFEKGCSWETASRCLLPVTTLSMLSSNISQGSKHDGSEVLSGILLTPELFQSILLAPPRDGEEFEDVASDSGSSKTAHSHKRKHKNSASGVCTGNDVALDDTHDRDDVLPSVSEVKSDEDIVRLELLQATRIMPEAAYGVRLSAMDERLSLAAQRVINSVCDTAFPSWPVNSIEGVSGSVSPCADPDSSGAWPIRCTPVWARWIRRMIHLGKLRLQMRTFVELREFFDTKLLGGRITQNNNDTASASARLINSVTSAAGIPTYHTLAWKGSAHVQTKITEAVSGAWNRTNTKATTEMTAQRQKPVPSSLHAMSVRSWQDMCEMVCSRVSMLLHAGPLGGAKLPKGERSAWLPSASVVKEVTEELSVDIGVGQNSAISAADLKAASKQRAWSNWVRTVKTRPSSHLGSTGSGLNDDRFSSFWWEFAPGVVSVLLGLTQKRPVQVNSSDSALETGLVVHVFATAEEVTECVSVLKSDIEASSNKTAIDKRDKQNCVVEVPTGGTLKNNVMPLFVVDVGKELKSKGFFTVVATPETASDFLSYLRVSARVVVHSGAVSLQKQVSGRKRKFQLGVKHPTENTARGGKKAGEHGVSQDLPTDMPTKRVQTIMSDSSEDETDEYEEEGESEDNYE